MLIDILKDYNFSEKEAKVYLTCLRLWNAIVSSIARHSWEHRITTYSILKDLKNRGIANEITKNKVKYFSVISAEKLLFNEEKKVEKLKEIMPEFLALSNSFSNKPKIYFYEWFQKVQNLFKEIVDFWNELNEPFLTFVWVQNMDKKFETFFEKEFLKYRKKQKNQTKAIVSKDNSNYWKYHKNNYETVFIEKNLFEMENEIVIFWEKIAILSYKKDEIYWLIIESKSLNKWLKSIFNLVWNAYKK